MKRYLVFGYNTYYPSGGTNDVVANFDTLEEVREFIKTNFNESHDVLDLQERRWLSEAEWTA